METILLEQHIAFKQLLQAVLIQLDEEWTGRDGHLRSGGRIDLDELGAQTWKEQFR